VVSVFKLDAAHAGDARPLRAPPRQPPRLAAVRSAPRAVAAMVKPAPRPAVALAAGAEWEQFQPSAASATDTRPTH